MSRRNPLRRTITQQHGIADAYGRRGARLATAGGRITVDVHPGHVVALAITDPATGVRIELQTDAVQWRKLLRHLVDELDTVDGWRLAAQQAATVARHFAPLHYLDDPASVDGPRPGLHCHVDDPAPIARNERCEAVPA